MRHVLILVACLPMLSACGLMPVPMVPRPTPEEFAAATVMWNNMFDPPSRLPAETLLDTVLYHQLHQNGVDSVRFRSEKKFAGGTVVTEVYYDYAFPLEDRFEIRVYGEHHRLLRWEQYTRADIERAVQSIGDENRLMPLPTPDGHEPSSEEREMYERRRRLYEEAKAIREHRMVEVHLATRPAAEAERIRAQLVTQPDLETTPPARPPDKPG